MLHKKGTLETKNFRGSKYKFNEGGYMKCLVTGGAGFIGSHMVDRLLKEGHEVAVIDNLSTGDAKNLRLTETSCHFGQLQDYKFSEEVFRQFKPEYVFHFAALPRVPRSLEDPVGTHDANVNATLVALELSRRYGVKRFMYSASSSAYGVQDHMPCDESMKPRPISPYGLQKYIGELYCKQYTKHFGLDTVALRYFNVYGPRQPMEGTYCLVIGVFLNQIKQGKKLTIFGDGTQTRDFTWIEDIVQGNYLSMLSTVNLEGQTINLGAGQEISVNRIAELIQSHLGGESEYINPNPRAAFEEARKVADNSKAKKLLNWEPTVFIEEGIKRLCEMT